mmetsp:Transcript_15856/g.22366  ORF Transcript_15856/g.22366 Transcript_15856/m.22366 type:complete len:452 (+) Transcript_15856:230-1585(+)
MKLLSLSPEIQQLKNKLDRFVQEECIPAESKYEEWMSQRSGAQRWTDDAIPPIIETLKRRAQTLGLWNLFIPPFLMKEIPSSLPSHLKPTVSLTYREYGILCESMGRSFLAPEACNCNAPDTGNMEVLLHFGTPSQKEQYLVPLLQGKIRSAFLMTEPQVASSDATNIETTLKRIEDGDQKGNIKYVLSGRKWWSTGAMDPRCHVAIVLAKMDYSHPSCTVSQNSSKINRHGSHTVVCIPLKNNPGIRMVRPLTVFGYDDAPHGHAEVNLDSIVVDPSQLIIGEGSGFQVAQARLGPGRIHHCMRSIGLAARCYELMLHRTMERQTFGKYLWQHGSCQESIADSASDLEAARLLTLNCADAMDNVGARKARDKIASIKVVVPELTSRVVDRAVQVFGGAGVSQDFVLARALAGLRTLRIADGPDAVHKRTLALLEIKKAKQQLKLTGKSNL